MKFNLNLYDALGYVSFCCIFLLWDLKIFLFDLRFFYFIPAIFLLFYKNFYINVNNNFSLLFTFLILLIFHSLYTSNYYSIEYELRELFSLIGLAFIFIFYCGYKNFFNSYICNSLNIFIYVISISVILEYIGIFSHSSIAMPIVPELFSRRSGIFFEPSHLGILLTGIYSIIILQLKSSKLKVNIYSYFLLAFTSLIAISTTLIVGIFFVLITKLIIDIFKNGKLSFFILIMFFLLILLSFKNEFIFVRLNTLNLLFTNFQIESNFNLSSAVFLNCYNVAINSLNYYLLGTGFNLYHIAHDNFSIRDSNLIFMSLDNMNRYDGSSNVFKLVVEFGIFSLIPIMISVISVFNLQKYREDNFYIFSVFIVIISSFRGVGYFNSGIIICFFYIFTKILNNRLINIKNEKNFECSKCK